MKNILKFTGYGLIFGGLAAVMIPATCQVIKSSSNIPNPPVVKIYHTPVPTPTPIVEPTPEATATPTIVPTPTVEPTPMIVPTPTPIIVPTPVLTAYEKFQQNLDVGEFNSYFTEDFFNEIGEKKSEVLLSYINNSLNSELSNLSDERVEKINRLLQRGPPQITRSGFKISRWNEYFENELSQEKTNYGHSEEELRVFMDYVNENGVDVFEKDISLYGDTVISFHNKNVLENYGHEIERLVNHARTEEVPIYLDNKTLSNFYSIIAEGAEWNREFLISQGSEERHRHYNLPEYVFTRSWFAYNTVIFKGSSESNGIGDNQALKLNVTRAKELQEHIQNIMTNQEDFSINNGPHEFRNDYERSSANFLEITKSTWIETKKSVEKLLDLYERSPEFNQIVKITNLTHFKENKTHGDVASNLTDIYSTLLGLEAPDLYAGYPYGSVAYGTRTESNAVRLSPEIREIFSDIVNPNDFIHDEWLPIPWWSDSIMRKDLVPYVYLSRPRERLYIWNINEESEQLFLSNGRVESIHEKELFDYIEQLEK